MSNGRSRHAKKIDTVHWTGSTFTFLAQAAGTVGQTLFAAQHLPETLLRLRGRWVGLITAAQGVSGLTNITCGVIQVPEGTGSTVLWSPTTDADAPWIWWDTMFVGHEEAVVDVIGVQAILGNQFAIDSKAMRKQRNTELQVVLESVTVNQAVSVDVAGEVRALHGS